MSPREFWLSNPGGRWQIDFDGPPIYVKDARIEIIYVREVVPIDWDKIWNEVTAEGFVLKAKEDRYLKELVEKLVQAQLTGEK